MASDVSNSVARLRGYIGKCATRRHRLLRQRILPGDTGRHAGYRPSAGDASVATNPVIVQIKQDAKPAKPRRVSMSAPCACPDAGTRNFT